MRQKRDKSGPGPEYRHIPRDAEGDPVFLILPDGVHATYDRCMSNCKALWLAASDPRAISEAHTLTMLYRQVSPLWLDEAIWRLACSRRTDAHAKRAREAMVRFMRYETVRDARGEGLSWEKAYAKAERVWADHPLVRAEATTMRKAYAMVLKDLKAGRGGLYIPPKQRRDIPAPEAKRGKPYD